MGGYALNTTRTARVRGWWKKSQRVTEPRYVKLYHDTYQGIFRSIAKKWAWILPIHDDAEGFSVDLWRYVWVKAVNTWDEERDFNKWVMFVCSQYLTDRKRRSLSVKCQQQKKALSLDAPIRGADDGDLTVGQQISENVEGFNSLIAQSEDLEWLDDALTKVRDPQVKAAVSIIVKYWDREKASATWRRLQLGLGMSRRRIEAMLRDDDDIQSMLSDLLTLPSPSERETAAV